MSQPAYLILPRAGFSPEKLDARLRSCGLVRTATQPRHAVQPRLIRWSDAAAEACSEAEYWEDHALGQRLIYLFGPRAQELANVCVQSWPCLSPNQALALARAASDPISKIETLAPWAVLLGDGAVTLVDAQAVLLARLCDADQAVRRAALFVCQRAPGSRGVELRAALRASPQLSPAARRGLTAVEQSSGAASAKDGGASPPAKVPAPPRNKDAGQEERQEDLLLSLKAALAQDPLASAAYWARAQLRAAAGQPWPALADVTTALALARRQGLHLKEMLELQNSLRAKLAQAPEPPTAADELQAVQQLAQLLRFGRFHEVEEIAERLLTLPGRPALWWLAVALARRGRGRSSLAIAALESALESEPEFQAARFVLGQCQHDLGNLEGARQDFARLDPQADTRPPRPTLLSAYADELLGEQAPWESPEHAFVRVQLLRQLDCPAEALAVTTRLVAGEAPAADALLAHGILLGELGRPAEALAALDRSLAVLKPGERLLTEPDPLSILQLHRAYALCALARRDEAAAALRVAQRLHPERAAAVAAELFPDAPPAPPSPPGYAVLRRLAQQELPPYDDTDDVCRPAAGVQAEPVAAAAATTASAGVLIDAAVAAAAVRTQAAELLVEALAALDSEKGPDPCRALLQRAERGLRALQSLLPPQMAAAAASVGELLPAVATALGLNPADADNLAHK